MTGLGIKTITAEEAQELMSSEERVMQLLASVKWKSGYNCRNCGHSNYCEGKSAHSRRCTRCKKDESAAANTLFHNVKFPLNKAFYMVYHVCVQGNDLTTGNYADRLGINMMTCWKFRKRILQCLEAHSGAKGRKDFMEKVLLGEQ